MKAAAPHTDTPPRLRVPPFLRAFVPFLNHPSSHHRPTFEMVSIETFSGVEGGTEKENHMPMDETEADMTGV